MSKNYNDCDIVLELLPLYIEQRTGEESNAFVGKHLAGCKECLEVYRLMSAEFPEPMEPESAGPGMINRGKKSRRKHLSPTAKRVLILAAGLLGYVCLMAGIVVYTFLRLTEGL